MEQTAEVLAVVQATVINVLRLHHLPNVAAQLRKNGDRAQDAGRFLGLPFAP